MANTTLNVTSLDRPTLRADLIAFLSNQAQFRDYDFTGSNLSVLIDLLAYNTNKAAFLVNMLFSEAFLDSAQLMSSVVSHAKELNYCPRSATSPVANVTVSFTATGENQPYVVPKGSSFSTLIKNQQYVFTMPETVVVSSANSSFQFTTDLYEGEYFKDGYVYVPTTDVPYPSFRVTNRSVDTSSLTVVVFEDDSVLGTTYSRATSLLDLTGQSTVYFLQATSDGFFEVLFGDGIVGNQPATGATVVLDYRVTVGPVADSASKFAINFDPTGTFSESTNVAVNTNASSAGGAPAETMGSIKYYAPRWYQTQERATAASDYETLLRVTFPEIQAVTTYGGEDSDPPLYGRVIISVALAGLDKLPASRQAVYTQFLTPRMPLGMRLLFVDPLFTFVQVSTTVKYNTSVTTNSPARIESLVTDAITSYDSQNLGDFGSQLLYSPFTTLIDKSDPSIISNSTSLLLYKKVNPVQLGESQSFGLDYQMPIEDDLPSFGYPHPTAFETAVDSSPFTFSGLSCRMEDDGNGNLNVVQDLGGQTSLVTRVGFVDYPNGFLNFTATFDTFQGDSIRVFVRAADSDLASAKNTILEIEPSGILVSAVPVTK